MAQRLKYKAQEEVFMNQNEVIERLKSEAAVNKVANAVFHVWAMRERARETATIASVYATMKHEGFNFTPDQLAPIFKLLADLRLGELDVSPKGKIRGLKAIHVTLQSIGRAAIASGQALDRYKTRTRYRKLVPRPESIKRVRPEAEVSVAVTINGRKYDVSLPIGATPEEIARLMRSLQDMQSA